MILIGLTGKAGAGKDTVADRLVAEHGFEKRSFAGPLKEMILKLDPILDDQGTRLSSVLREFGYNLNAESEAHLKRHYGEYRRLLQVLGTECIRAVDEDFWVKAAMGSLKNLKNLNGDARIVFSDARFPNEVQAIQDFKAGNFPHNQIAEVWHIDRPGAGTRAHSSEEGAGSMGEDLRIDNDRDMRTLHREIDGEAKSLASIEKVDFLA